MNYGKLVATRKSKQYVGKSIITHKALYRTSYGVYFYNEGDKEIGFLASDKPFTFSKGFDRKSEAENFLRGIGHNDVEWQTD